MCLCACLCVQDAVVVAEGSKRDMLEMDDLQFANNIAREFQLLLGRAWRQASRNRAVQVRAGGSLAGLRCAVAERSQLAWPCFAVDCHACLSCPAPSCPPTASIHPLLLPCYPTLPLLRLLLCPHTPQIVTFIQTVVIGFLLAWLYSDMSKTAAGIQDEIGWVGGALFYARVCSTGPLHTSACHGSNVRLLKAGEGGLETSACLHTCIPQLISTLLLLPPPLPLYTPAGSSSSQVGLCPCMLLPLLLAAVALCCHRGFALRVPRHGCRFILSLLICMRAWAPVLLQSSSLPWDPWLAGAAE